MHDGRSVTVGEPTAERGRDRLVLVDVGELRTRAEGYALRGGEVSLLGRLELESAAGHGELPARAGARRGMDSAFGDRVEAPLVVVEPGRRAEDRAFLAVGKTAATLGGYPALLAGEATREKVEAVLHAVIFPYVRSGDRVHLVLVDGPTAVADRLREGPARWRATPLSICAFDGWRGELETRNVTVTTHFLPAGEVFTELVYESGWIEEEGAPAMVLDVGHRTSRLYTVDFMQGLLDLEIIAHGGVRLLEHARRYARVLRAAATGPGEGVVRRHRPAPPQAGRARRALAGLAPGGGRRR
jgi:hypothetical protein